MHKVYGNNKINGWEVVATRKTLDEALKVADKLKADEYYSYLIKTRENDGDVIVAQGNLYKECKVEYVDKVKEKYEVRAMEFKVKEKERKPSKMKKKEELRKLTEEYIDR